VVGRLPDCLDLEGVRDGVTEVEAVGVLETELDRVAEVEGVGVLDGFLESEVEAVRDTVFEIERVGVGVGFAAVVGVGGGAAL